MSWDILIRGAKVFDGKGGPVEDVDVAIQDGRIAVFGHDLPKSSTARVEHAFRWCGRRGVRGRTEGVAGNGLHWDIRPGASWTGADRNGLVNE